MSIVLVKERKCPKCGDPDYSAIYKKGKVVRYACINVKKKCDYIEEVKENSNMPNMPKDIYTLGKTSLVSKTIY